MLKLKILIWALFLTYTTQAQTLNGTWSGTHKVQNIETGDYNLAITQTQSTISGESFTEWFDGSISQCTISGNASTSSITIDEVKSMNKENNSCLFNMKLRYVVENQQEYLVGTYTSSPNTEKIAGNCGWSQGTIVLKKIKPYIEIKKVPNPVDEATFLRLQALEKEQTKKEQEAEALRVKKAQEQLKSRSTDVQQVLEVHQKHLKIEIVDYSTSDGDIVSVFFNQKLIVSHQEITKKPIIVEVDIDEKIGTNQIAMFAENLGSIPPNTSMLRIHDGKKLHEIKISSTIKTNGTINLKYQPSKP